MHVKVQDTLHETVNILVKSNADVSIQNKDGKIALDLAKFYHYECVVAFLISAQCNLITGREFHPMKNSKSESVEIGRTRITADTSPFGLQMFAAD